MERSAKVKAILILLSGLVAAVVVFIGGMAVSAYMIADPAPHRFAHLDTPDLWTAEPVRIDTQKQAYERVPGPVLAADVPASDLPDVMVAARGPAKAAAASSEAPGATVAADAQPASVASVGAPPVVDTAQAESCFARYRSYRIEDNSYQPYDGGPRRPCELPGQAQHMAAAAGDMAASDGSAGDEEGSHALVQNAAIKGDENVVPVQTAGASASGDTSGSHDEWCSARYRSYRAGDNSYQPFDGGPRKACQSPFG